MAKRNPTNAKPERRQGRSVTRDETGTRIEPAAAQRAIEKRDAETAKHNLAKSGLALASTPQWSDARRGRDRIAVTLRDAAMEARSSNEVVTRGDLVARYAHGLIKSEQPVAILAAFQRGEDLTVDASQSSSGGKDIGSRGALANGRSSQILTSEKGSRLRRLLNSGKTLHAD